MFEDSIYPSQDEFKVATENLLKEEHNEFFKKFKRDKWTIFYEKNIYQSVSNKYKWCNSYRLSKY